MEFTNKRPAKPDAAEIQLRLLNWPDSYYRERDPKIRLEILDAADARGLTPAENELRRKLFHLRYPGVEKGERDLFIKAWLDMRFLAEQGDGFFARRRNPDKVRRILDRIGLSDVSDRMYRGVLYEELVHLGMLYISLCEEDKHFSSVMFGLGQLSDDSRARKIRKEFRAVAVITPEKYGTRTEYPLWTEALTAAFESACPEYAGTLDREI